MLHATTHNQAKSDLHTLVYRIHAATEQDAGWTPALELLRQQLGAHCAVLGYHDFASGTGCTLYDAPHNEVLATEFARYAPRNPWFLSSVEYRRGRVMTGNELIGHRELVRTDFFRSVLKPHGLLHRLSGVVSRYGEVAYYVDLLRAEDQPPFGSHERASLKLVFPHIQLALENCFRCRHADDLAKVLTNVAVQTGQATLLVAPDGRIAHRSGSEDRWIESVLGLRIRDNILSTVSPGDARALREAIVEATRADVPEERSASRVVALSVAGSPQQVMVTVRPAGEVFLATHGSTCRLAAITTRIGHIARDLKECALACRYDLTPAQAKVSALVFSGNSIASVAQALGVSDNTVRSHLKQIFQKTDTHSQMELVHVHAQLCVGCG